MPKLPRYGPGARVYDVVSGERLVYRVGRVAGIDALRLSPGDVVLDLGCGTGLNLPLLVKRVGPSGLVVGVDRSGDMLRMARRRVSRNNWNNVRLVQADIAELTSAALATSAAEGQPTVPTKQQRPASTEQQPAVPTELQRPPVSAEKLPSAVSTERQPARDDARGPLFDAAIASYAMSVFDDWHPAWDLMRAGLKPGGRISIVDMARPVGLGALLTPVAILACALGGADIDAAPWRELEVIGTDVSHSTHRSGHIHAVAGSFP